MTECTPNRASFSRAKGRVVEVDFSGGVVTSDGGLVLLRAADRQLGQFDRLDAAIPDPAIPIASPIRNARSWSNASSGSPVGTKT